MPETTNTRLIQIGKRILNLGAVRYMEVNGSRLSVYLVGGAALEFVDEEAETLLRILKDTIEGDAAASAESARELLKVMKTPTE